MTEQATTPWSRRDGETTKAYAAFGKYLLGSGRSLMDARVCL